MSSSTPKTFHLTIAKIGENLFDDEAVSVSLPGADGRFEVLANHQAFVSELVPGNVRVVCTKGEKKHFEIIENSIAEVSFNQATILL